jgi:D-alanyl-D-alanine carboxypeptidase
MKMKKTDDLIQQLGHPMRRQEAFCNAWMILWTVPEDIHVAIPVLRAQMYINRIIAAPLEKVLRQLITEGLHKEIKTFDGCYNPRLSRGLTTISRHAFGLAIDLNAAQNPLFGTVNWSDGFLSVWRENDWTCGADWQTRKDGMHFQFDAFTAADIEQYLSSFKP